MTTQPLFSGKSRTVSESRMKTGRVVVDTRWKSIGRVAVLVLAGLGILFGLAVLVWHLATDPLGDVHAYYDAGARLNAGLPLYAQSVSTSAADFYRYPPLLAILFRPLALLPFGVAAVIWECVVVASFVWTLLLLGRRTSVVVALALVAVPLAWCLAIGQAEVVMLLLVTIGSPLSIALGASVKLLPIFFGIYWVGRRDRRRLGELAVWLLVLAGVQVILEPSGSLAYAEFILAGQGTGGGDVSLFGVSHVLWLAVVIVVGVVALIGARTRYGRALAVAFMLACSPRLLVYQVGMALAALRRVPALTEQRAEPPEIVGVPVPQDVGRPGRDGVLPDGAAVQP